MPAGAAMPNNMGGGAVANNSAISSQPFNTFIPNIQGFGQGNNTFIPSAFSQNNMMGAANQASVAPNEAPSGQAPVDANTASAEQESPMDFVRNQKIPSSLGGELKQQEYQAILEALVDCRGNRQAVADKLGISPRTLRYKIARMREEGMVIPS